MHCDFCNPRGSIRRKGFIQSLVGGEQEREGHDFTEETILVQILKDA